MTTDFISLGKLKKSLLEAIDRKDEEDRNVYVLSDALNLLADKYPDSYLRKIEGMKSIVSNPDFISKGKNKLHLYRLYYENKRFYLTILSIERKERWIFKGIQAHSYPAKETDDVLRIH